MKILQCTQGTDEWLMARLGIPTASNFDRIVTPKGLKPSASGTGYLAQLAAEWFLGTPLDEASSAYMNRGTGMEAEARRYYELAQDVTVDQVGFIMTDDGLAGCSPDGLVGDAGLVEIKCPSAKTMMGYVLAGGTDEYAMQVQGELWVTGRKWCDLCLYHPVMPSIITRIVPDPAVQAAFTAEIPKFAARLDEARAMLLPSRPEPVAVGADADESPF